MLAVDRVYSQSLTFVSFFLCRQYVWQIDSSVPVQWQNVPLVLRLHKADAPAVNNVPTEVSYWVTFNLVCLEPALRVAQPPAVHCGDALTVRWEYLDTAKRMWSTADRVVLELWAHTGVRSFDFRIATLAQDVAYPTASYRWVVPKQLPQQWPAADENNRVFFVVRHATNEDLTSKGICLLCPYPFLTCATRPATGGGEPDVDGRTSMPSGTVTVAAGPNSATGPTQAPLPTSIVIIAALAGVCGCIILVLCVGGVVWFVRSPNRRLVRSERTTMDLSGAATVHMKQDRPQTMDAGSDGEYIGEKYQTANFGTTTTAEREPYKLNKFQSAPSLQNIPTVKPAF